MKKIILWGLLIFYSIIILVFYLSRLQEGLDVNATMDEDTNDHNNDMIDIDMDHLNVPKIHMGNLLSKNITINPGKMREGLSGNVHTSGKKNKKHNNN